MPRTASLDDLSTTITHALCTRSTNVESRPHAGAELYKYVILGGRRPRRPALPRPDRYDCMYADLERDPRRDLRLNPADASRREHSRSRLCPSNPKKRSPKKSAPTRRDTIRSARRHCGGHETRMEVDELTLSAGVHVRQLSSGPLGGSATNNKAPGENTSAKTHTAAEMSTETSTAG